MSNDAVENPSYNEIFKDFYSNFRIIDKWISNRKTKSARAFSGIYRYPSVCLF